MADDKNMHAGHRQRLLHLADKVRLKNLTNIQQVELFLFYIFPRGDVNPLAHKLLDKFGNFYNIITADKEEIISVPGIGKAAALKIVTFLQLFDLFASNALGEKVDLTYYGDLCDYAENLLRLNPVEELHILALNAKNELVRDECLARGSFRYVSIPVRVITSFLISTNCPTYILIHNHPGGVCNPSDYDINGTEYMKDVLTIHSVQLSDHLIVASDGIYSINKKQVLRLYKPENKNKAI